MRKIQQPPAQEEIVYGSAKPKESVAISREVRAGRLRRITPKLNTANFRDADVVPMLKKCHIMSSR